MAHLVCSRCGLGGALDDGCKDPERFVRDVASGRIYCEWCADTLSRICWDRPAVIRSAGEGR